MKTITVEGNPESMTAIMVPQTDIYKEHDTIKIEAADGSAFVLKTIFRIVDAGEDKLELQFE